MVQIGNREKRHALTNTHSADRVSRNTVIEPIGLHKFTRTSTGTQRAGHSSHNTIIQTSASRKLTMSKYENTADTKCVLQ
jgi:hypothetical protein